MLVDLELLYSRFSNGLRVLYKPKNYEHAIRSISPFK